MHRNCCNVRSKEVTIRARRGESRRRSTAGIEEEAAAAAVLDAQIDDEQRRG